jgi:ornithine cyclodeaminase
LFDYETGRPRVLAEAGLLSAIRTAAFTVASIRHLGPATIDSIAIVGCGALARAHCDLIARHLPGVRRLVVFDLEASRMASLAGALEDVSPSIDVRQAASAREAVVSSNVLVTTTTTTTGYIEPDWFLPGSFVAHVSLDDLVPLVFFEAQAVYVDDIELVRDNPRRILGRLLGEDGAERIPLVGSLGEVIVGAVPAIRPSNGVVVSNPFGMAILDIALLDAVSKAAAAAGLGRPLDLYGTS